MWIGFFMAFEHSQRYNGFIHLKKMLGKNIALDKAVGRSG
jgi:hypothetical protein